MFGSSDSKVKKLGELLQEAGFASEQDIQRAVELSRKNFQSLGKVLVQLRICTEPDIKCALDVQKLCKLESMSGRVAVRVLTIMRSDGMLEAEALQKVGWSSPNYNPFQEPEDIVAAKKALKDPAAAEGVGLGKAIEAIGDAYARNKLTARAESKYDEAMEIFEKCKPRAVAELSNILTKLSTVAIEQRRHEDAKALLAQAQKLLEESGQRESREYAKVLHASAEYHVSRRKFSDAERHFIESFNMLNLQYGLEDEHVLSVLRRYVETMGKSTRDAEKVTLGELLKGSGAASEEQVTRAWQISKRDKIALGRAIVQAGLINEPQLELILQAQLLVANNEITRQLSIWITRYCFELGKGLDEVLELFNCVPKSRSALAEELKTTSKQLSELESRLPPTHAELAFGHEKLAKIYSQRQQWLQAENHYKRALEIASVNQNLNPEKAIGMVDDYAELKIIQADLDASIKILKLSVQLRSKHFGADSVMYAKGIEKLAEVFCKKSDHNTAAACYDRSLAVRERLYGRDGKELIACLEAKSDCLVHAGEFKDAEPVLDSAFAIAEDNFGRGNEVTDRILLKLVAVCKELGKVEKISEISPGHIQDVLI